MTIQFCSGDIFVTDDSIGLAHGCNCAGAMGKGIAPEFKRRWPEMYREYKARCQSGQFTVGDIFLWIDPDSGRAIFNMGTQRTWRTKTTLEAIAEASRNLLVEANAAQVSTIAMPLIGSGLGGLAPSDVKHLLTEIASDDSVHLLVCETYVAGQPPE